MLDQIVGWGPEPLTLLKVRSPHSSLWANTEIRNHDSSVFDTPSMWTVNQLKSLFMTVLGLVALLGDGVRPASLTLLREPGINNPVPVLRDDAAPSLDRRPSRRIKPFLKSHPLGS